MAHQPSYTYKTGLGNSAAYQVSGTPFVSGTISCADGDPYVRVAFPRVSQWVAFTNQDNANRTLHVAFSENGLTNQTAMFEIAPSASLAPLELKVTEVWISGSSNCAVIAGLSSIEVDQINNSSVSPNGDFRNWSGSVAARVG